MRSCRNLQGLLACLLLMLLSVQEVYGVEGDTTTLTPSMLQRPVAAAPKNGTVIVSGFRFSGNESIPSEELALLLVPWIGKECDLDMLRSAAGKVSDEYLRRGSQLTRAFIPQQTISEGMVTILVVEGRIGDIIIEGNRNYPASFIRQHLLDRDKNPTIEGIERGLLHLNQDFQELKVTANFVPGRMPGTTDVKVTVDEGRSLHLSLTANNFGTDYVSRYRFGTRLEWSNAVIPGAFLAIGGVAGERSEDMHVLSGLFECPVSRRGTMLGVSVYDGNFDVSKEFAELNIHNDQISGELYLRHPVFRQRRGRLTGTLGFRAAEAKQYLLGEINSRDNTRAVYLQVQGDRTWGGGRSLGGVSLTRGLGELFGGTGDDNLFVSRSGASNQFFKATLEMAQYQPITNRISAMLRFSGQWSQDNLLASEEWLVGGMDSVHGFVVGEGSGDKGWSAGISMSANPLANRDILQVNAYLDYGYAYKNRIYSGSKHTTELTGIGVGITSHLDTIAPTDLRLELGFPCDPSTNYSGDRMVLYFNTSIRF